MQVRPTVFHAVAGSSFAGRLQLFEDGAPMNITGAVVRMEIAPGPGKTPQLAYESASGLPGIEVEDAETGKIRYHVPPEETRLWGAGRWEARFLVIWDDVSVVPVAGGPLVVEAELVPRVVS